MSRAYRDPAPVKTLSLEDMIRRAEARPPFRVPGLIHSALTGVAGEPFVGKSSLATHLVISGIRGESFLGVPWESKPDRILLALTDPGAVEEYGDRFKTAGLVSGELRTHEGAVSAGGWAELRQDQSFPLTDHSLVVIDTLTGCLPDLNSITDAYDFFGEVTAELCAHGVAVVVLMHMSEKRGKDGYRMRVPMGTTSISSHIRHRLTLTRAPGGGVSVTTTGNQATEELDIVARQRKHAADWEVISAGPRVKREKATLDRNAEIADWVVAECQGSNKTAAADKVAKQFGLTRATAKKRLQPSQSVGKLVELRGSEWVRTG